jgi:hypothetical protein
VAAPNRYKLYVDKVKSPTDVIWRPKASICVDVHIKCQAWYFLGHQCFVSKKLVLSIPHPMVSIGSSPCSLYIYIHIYIYKTISGVHPPSLRTLLWPEEDVKPAAILGLLREARIERQRGNGIQNIHWPPCFFNGMLTPQTIPRGMFYDFSLRFELPDCVFFQIFRCKAELGTAELGPTGGPQPSCGGAISRVRVVGIWAMGSGWFRWNSCDYLNHFETTNHRPPNDHSVGLQFD